MFPWLTVLGAVPLVGSVVVALLPKGRDLLAKQVALAFSLVVLGLTVAMALQFDATSREPFQFVETHEWIPAFGVSYALGVDGIALVLVALSAVLVPIVMIAGWHEADGARGSVKGYFALILALEVFMIGVFAATDVFLFYVFFEAMLIPMYFLIGRYGGPQRQYAAVKFLLYSLAGGLLMLAALIGLYVVSADEQGQGDVRLPDAGGPRHRPDHAEVAVPRLLHRLRDQGAAVAGPHLAARRRRREHPRLRRSCSSGSSTRSAPSACCGSACRCSPTPRSTTPPRSSSSRSSASSTARCWRSARPT